MSFYCLEGRPHPHAHVPIGWHGGPRDTEVPEDAAFRGSSPSNGPSSSIPFLVARHCAFVASASVYGEDMSFHVCGLRVAQKASKSATTTGKVGGRGLRMVFIPVVIGWIVWRATGSIFIGAFVAFAIEGFLAALAKKDGE